MQGLISDEILFYRGLFPQTYDVGFRLQNDNLFHDLLKNIKLDAPLNSKINIMEVNELWRNLLESGDNIKKMALSSRLLKNISLINSLKNKC